MIKRDKHNPNSHLTVKERTSPSLPVKALYERNMIKGETLDFGCGLGNDIEYLQDKGFAVIGYDPYYAPTYPRKKFDTILCFYVLNVLLPEEQAHVLMAISELLKPNGKAFFAIRRDVNWNGFRFNPKREIYVYQCNVNLPYKTVFQTDNCHIYQYQRYTELNRDKEEISPFLNGINDDRFITESARAFAIYDKYPVSDGHALVIPKSNVPDYFELTKKEQESCLIMINRVKMLLEKRYHPSGFNVGINAGKVAGQTVSHAHIHIIPRYQDDVDNPKGGIRNVIRNQRVLPSL